MFKELLKKYILETKQVKRLLKNIQRLTDKLTKGKKL